MVTHGYTNGGKSVQEGTQFCSYNTNYDNPKYKLKRFMIFKIDHL